MNQKANNDIDILLRKLSRENGNSAKSQQGDQIHLDADELNAYSENALPLALRARYTEHLAECTNCRNIVTQLSLGSAAAVPRQVEEVKPAALKTFLAGLFSPLVFRYAVPAMAIVVVVTIAWIALQRRSYSPQVAQNLESQRQAPASEVAAEEQINAARSDDPVVSKNSDSEPKQTSARTAEKTVVPGDAPDTTRQQVISEEKQLAASTTDDSRDRKDLKRNEQPPAAAPVGAGTSGAVTSGAVTVAATPQPKPQAERQLEVAQKKESDANKTKVLNEAQTYDGIVQSRPAKTPEAKAPSKSAPAEAAGAGRALRRSESRAKEETEAGEVRTVGGHRFRKQGQVWIDSLFSSQSITNVTRASEQYRALVADEPGIRLIAEQLNAEFIVVWKGRAYRIR